MTLATLRDTNKADKLKRIEEAARHLFGTQGFDATSTREIAARAGVGLATLFLYADDKRDLLFLAGNTDLEELTQRAFADLRYSSSVLTQLMSVFRHFFTFYDKNRLFFRDLLRELTFYSAGQQSSRFQVTRQTTIDSIKSIVVNARKHGTIKHSASDAEIAQVIFYIFAADVRRWLGQEISSISAGLDHLRSMLSIVLAGLESP